MCSVAQRLEDRGIEKGRVEGRAEGRIELLVSLCKNGHISIEVAADQEKQRNIKRCKEAYLRKRRFASFFQK